MARFAAAAPHGVAVQQLEVLVRAAIFKPANALVGRLLQAAAERVDASYPPKPGEVRKGRASLQVQGLFGSFELVRTTITTRAGNRATTPPMRRWDWRSAIPRRWPV